MPRFTRENRLISKQDFQRVFASRCKIAHKYLVAIYCPSGLQLARLGLVIAKHHIPLAVDRNRIRRILRESFRQQQDALKGLDIIILLRSECTPQGNTLRQDIDSLWPLLKKV